MEENHCRDYQYFFRHYALLRDRIVQVYCGHCTWKTPKTRRPDRKACEHFRQREKETDQFVSKEYLSKKLLDKVLSMELLPEIKESPGSAEDAGFD